MHDAFQVHKLTTEGIQQAEDIAFLFDKFLEDLSAYMYDGRCKAIVTTKLEEASFFAKKAMAKNPKLYREE